MPIFRVKSVKIYTGQKKSTRVYPWLPWQIWGMVLTISWVFSFKLNGQNLLVYSLTDLRVRRFMPLKLSISFLTLPLKLLENNCFVWKAILKHPSAHFAGLSVTNNLSTLRSKATTWSLLLPMIMLKVSLFSFFQSNKMVVGHCGYQRYWTKIKVARVSAIKPTPRFLTKPSPTHIWLIL